MIDPLFFFTTKPKKGMQSFKTADSNMNGSTHTDAHWFVRCNPDGDQANCVTQQSPEMEWSPDLPSKLPASAEAEEEESKLSESTGIFLGEEGSGGYEGSAAEGPYIADKSNLGETGSGMLWKESGGIFCRTGFAWIQ
uniref:Uncharacterized protein n=1 Tax=Neolamprologus brichardi TaxID=32507 RepID=A0A3Q4GFI0_NEOBR